MLLLKALLLAVIHLIVGILAMTVVVAKQNQDQTILQLEYGNVQRKRTN